jgi:L-fuconolactonase
MRRAACITDSHVHFWDPGEIEYPWLESLPSLHKPFLPTDYSAAVTRFLFVESNCRPEDAIREVRFVERLAAHEPRIAGIVAFADMTDPELERALDTVSCLPLVKGLRHNIQGNAAGFALQPAFVAGVRAVGRRGLTFDLCATHDQLAEVCELVQRCPDTQFVLDHCGKPAIRLGRLEPWSEDVARLAAHPNVCCKLSGLLTEAGEHRSDAGLLPYANAVVDFFGVERLLYGSDWPVLTLAGRSDEWFGFTERLTAGWSATESSLFYEGNAVRVYRL